MKILTLNKKENKVIAITSDSVTFENSSLKVGGTVFCNIGEDDVTQYDVDTVPTDATSKYHSYDGVAWFIHKSSVPTEVTMEQAQLAMLDAGLLDQVELAIANDSKAQIRWKYATEFHRNDPMVQAISGSLGLTESQLDELFISASSKP